MESAVCGAGDQDVGQGLDLEQGLGKDWGPDWDQVVGWASAVWGAGD